MLPFPVISCIYALVESQVRLLELPVSTLSTAVSRLIVGAWGSVAHDNILNWDRIMLPDYVQSRAPCWQIKHECLCICQGVCFKFSFKRIFSVFILSDWSQVPQDTFVKIYKMPEPRPIGRSQKALPSSGDKRRRRPREEEEEGEEEDR